MNIICENQYGMSFYIDFISESALLKHDEEFEKQVDEYAKIQNKIEELKEQIEFLEKLIAKNGHYEAVYEDIIRDYFNKKRSQLFCLEVGG